VVVGEVHGGAGELHAGRQHCLVDATAVHAAAAEGGDQRRVHVDAAALVAAAQLEDREEAEQRDQLRVVLRQLGVDRVVEGASVRESPARQRQRRDPAPGGATQAAGVLLRRDHQHHARRHLAGVDPLAQVLEAGALAREQHRDAQRLHRPNRFWWTRRAAGERFSV